jgi:hypothetical protein
MDQIGKLFVADETRRNTPFVNQYLVSLDPQLSNLCPIPFPVSVVLSSTHLPASFLLISLQISKLGYSVAFRLGCLISVRKKHPLLL